MTAAWTVALALAAVAAPKSKTELSQEITIKGEGASGPGVQVPRPRADKEIVDEVVRSLDLYQGDEKADAPELTVPAASKRLSRPFPEPPFLTFSPRSVKAPYDSWFFEVLSVGEVVWRTEGDGRLREPIEWDGSGSSGATVARVERPYRFRFTGKSGPARFTISSRPVVLRSLSYREYLGDTHLEASTSLLFKPGGASFADSAQEYLPVLADRARRVTIGERPYRFLLYSPEPRGALARRRAKVLRDYFAKHLLINPRRVEIEVLSAGERGEAVACVLPADKGDAFRAD